MYTCLKRIMIAVLCLVLLSPLSVDLKAQAQTAPSVSVSVPSRIDVQTGENFVITVAVSVTGQDAIISNVVASPGSQDIRIESQTVNRIVSAGSSINVNLVGSAHASGLHRLRIDIIYTQIALKSIDTLLYRRRSLWDSDIF